MKSDNNFFLKIARKVSTVAIIRTLARSTKQVEIEHLESILGLHMSPNILCYVTRHFLFCPYVAMSLFIRP